MTDDKSRVAETPDDDPWDDTDQEYEQQWQDLDEKVILVQILTELQQIRMVLSDAERGASDNSSQEVAYRCTRCEETMPAGKRERHARQQHKAPEDMIARMFVEVDG